MGFLDFQSERLPTFDIQVSSTMPMKFRQFAFWFRRKKFKYTFNMSARATILDFDQNDCSYFELQVIPILPIEFRVSWHFRSGDEVGNRFSRWRLWQPYWIFDQNNLLFLIYMSARYYQVSS